MEAITGFGLLTAGAVDKLGGNNESMLSSAGSLEGGKRLLRLSGVELLRLKNDLELMLIFFTMGLLLSTAVGKEVTDDCTVIGLG